MKKPRKNIVSSLPIPNWVGNTYILMALFLSPWTIYLALTLPNRYTTYDWATTWVGLDIAIMIGLLLSGFLALFKSTLAILTISATGTLLTLDAWFDITTAKHHGGQLDQSIALAIFIELPLAFISYLIAYRLIKNQK